DPAFDGFPRPSVVKFAAALGMSAYSSDLARRMTTLFAPSELAHTLGQLVAEAGLRQLRIAETEKYAHVTFFFNGGEEREFKGEERCLVPSPRIATYDLKPEMSAPEVTAELLRRLGAAPRQVVVLHYANRDLIGH